MALPIDIALSSKIQRGHTHAELVSTVPVVTALAAAPSVPAIPSLALRINRARSTIDEPFDALAKQVSAESVLTIASAATTISAEARSALDILGAVVGHRLPNAESLETANIAPTIEAPGLAAETFDAEPSLANHIVNALFNDGIGDAEPLEVRDVASSILTRRFAADSVYANSRRTITIGCADFGYECGEASSLERWEVAAPGLTTLVTAPAIHTETIVAWVEDVEAPWGFGASDTEASKDWRLRDQREAQSECEIQTPTNVSARDRWPLRIHVEAVPRH